MFGLKLFDIVIGNPPYVFGGNTGISAEAKKQYKERYVSGKGKINLFAIFIERGSQLLKKNGALSFILPNTLLRVTSYKAIRNLILTQLKVEEILDLDVGVFDKVTASTIAIRICNHPPSDGHLASIRHGLDDTTPKVIRQDSWIAGGGIIDIFSSDQDRAIVERIEADSVPLGELCHRIRFGVVISGNLDQVVGSVRHNPSWKRFLEGDEIEPYGINYEGRFFTLRKGSATPKQDFRYL